MRILPSLASADQMRLGEIIRTLGDYPYLHFDIEDGNFVPNITFGLKTVRQAMQLTQAEADAHLMVTNPEAYVDSLADAGFRAAAFHWEAAGYPLRVITAIKKRGMRAGIALNPRTPAGEIAPYLTVADYVLLMLSEPDGQGERYQEEMLPKISYLAEYGPKSLEILVDGGLGEVQLRQVKTAGATAAVVGRAVFSGEDPVKLLEKYSHI